MYEGMPVIEASDQKALEKKLAAMDPQPHEKRTQFEECINYRQSLSNVPV